MCSLLTIVSFPPKGEQCFTFRTVMGSTILAVHAGSWPPVWLWWLSCSTSVSGRESRPLERWEAVQLLREIYLHSHGRVFTQVEFDRKQKQVFSVALSGDCFCSNCVNVILLSRMCTESETLAWDFFIFLFFILRAWTRCGSSRLCGSQPQCPMWSWLCCWSAESPCPEPPMALRPTCLWTSGDSAKPRWALTAAMGEGKTVPSA